MLTRSRGSNSSASTAARSHGLFDPSNTRFSSTSTLQSPVEAMKKVGKIFHLYLWHEPSIGIYLNSLIFSESTCPCWCFVTPVCALLV